MMELEPVGIHGNGHVSQDLDLIDVLWRQDIDLGVGKEVFDINLRRELEREREVELQKERQKQKERELLQIKLDEQRRRQQQQWMAENFMQDGETGEWVPLNGRRVPPSQTITSPQNHSAIQNVTTPQVPASINQNITDSPHNINQSNQFQNFIPYDNGMSMGNGFRQSQPQMLPPTHPHHLPPPPQMQQDGADYHHMGASPNHSMPYPQGQMNASLQQQQQHNCNFSQPQMAQQQPEYPRQESLEQTWQDLVNLLELPSNDTTNITNLQNMTNNMVTNNNMGVSNVGGANVMPMSHGMMSPSQGGHTPLMSPQTPLPSPLIQNATMPQPVNNSNGNFEQVPQSSANFTSTAPGGEDCPTRLDWDPRSLMFPNSSSSPMDQNNTLDEVEGILSDIIEDNLDDLNITEMELNDGLRSMQMLDDSSSESGVSMGSTGSPAQDQFSESAMSPFDGLEGATGGKDYGDSPSYNKGSDKFSYSNGGYNFNNNDNGGDSQSNYSSSSNDTDFNFRHSGTNHIHHNHSYPLKPGQEPREYKKYTLTDRPKQKGPHCRDQKRIEELKIPLTMDQIVESPVEEFNEILTRHKLTEPQLQLIRDIRRRGKNKVAAQNCRKRKMDVIVNLEDEMSLLKDQKDKLLAERHMIDKQTRDMKEKFSMLYREIFQSLRDEHGRPYDPHHFSLQQSSDGNVFLVPRNLTADEQQAKMKKRKDDKKED